MVDSDTQHDLITLAADIVAAHVSHNNVAVGDLPSLIRSVHAALANVSAPAPIEEPAPEPAVSIRASIKPDYLVCLEDGKKLKMLKRYLRTNYDMTPEEYRAKWGLPKDYPMVAPNYREKRSALALSNGLGKGKPKSMDGKGNVVEGGEQGRAAIKAPKAAKATTVGNAPIAAAKRGRPAKAAAASVEAAPASTPAPTKRAKLKVVTPK